MATLGTIPSNSTLTSADVSDFTEAVQDTLNTTLVAGTGISLVYNDAANTYTINSTGGGGGGSIAVADTNSVDMTWDGTTLSAVIPTTATPTIRKLTLSAAAMTDRVIDDTVHGDPQYYFSETLDGLRWDIRHGKTASPNTTPGPTVKISRKETLDGAAYAGTGTSPVISGALQVITVGTAGTTAQPVSIMARATTSATATPSIPSVNTDVTTIMGFARVESGGSGRAVSGYFQADTLSSVSGSGCTAVEFQVRNQTGTSHTWASRGAVGYGSYTMAAWINTAGTYNPAVALQIGKNSSTQFDVGIGFTGSGSGTQGNAILSASVRDDGTALYSYLINGTHATAAIAIAGGAGPLLVGATSTAISTKALIVSPADNQNALVLQSHSATQINAILQVFDSTGATEYFGIRATGNMAIGDGLNVILGSTTGTKIGTATTQKLGFFNKAPVVQQVLAAAGSDAATTQTLANSLRTALINLGLGA